MGYSCGLTCWQVVKLVAIIKVVEYAPNMYHSVAYEPLTQITDEGIWCNGLIHLDNGRGEYYNTNKFNPFAMNMRLPAPNTVRRNANGWLPYRGANDTTGLTFSKQPW
jgi:hypothetical protein